MPNPPTSQFIIYHTEDGETRLEVRLEDETVWLFHRSRVKNESSSRRCSYEKTHP